MSSRLWSRGWRTRLPAPNQNPGWSWAGATQHHLIDPRTGRPARTDVVQATVIARSARAAETFAKTAVIVGSEPAARRLDRADILGQILVTEPGDVLVTPATLALLA